MTDLTTPTEGYIADYLYPGRRIWFRCQYINDKGKMVEEVFGNNGDVTYQGYTTVANATFLVFDKVSGAGKKAKAEQFAINATHCPHIGPFCG